MSGGIPSTLKDEDNRFLASSTCAGEKIFKRKSDGESSQKSKKQAVDSRRSPAAQSFIEETVQKTATADQVLQLLNDAIESKEKMVTLKNLHIVHDLIHKEPRLLVTFLHEVVGFQHKKNVEVRRFVVQFIKDVCKQEPKSLQKVVGILDSMLQDPSIKIRKKVIQTVIQLYTVAIKWLCNAKKIDEIMIATWASMSGLKSKIFALLDSDKEGLRTLSVKFMEAVVLAQTPKDQYYNLKNNESSLDDIPVIVKIFEPGKMEEEAKEVFKNIIEFHNASYVSCFNLMACMQVLTTIAKKRFQFYSKVLQAFESMNANMPPTLSLSQVISVRKMLKVQLFNLTKHAGALEFQSQISTMLSALGVTPVQIDQCFLPRNSGEKHIVLEVDVGFSKQEVGHSQISQLGPSEIAPINDTPKISAVDITADDLLPKFTYGNTADLTLVCMFCLPDVMPVHFQSTYTPFTEIQHLARLLATQMTEAGFGKGIECKMESDNGKEDFCVEDDSSAKQIKTMANLTTDAGFGKDIETKMESDSGKVDLNAEDESATKHIKAVVNLTTDAGFGKDVETKMESDSGKMDLNAEDDSTTKHIKAVVNLTTDAEFGKDFETKMESDSGKVDLNAEDDSTTRHIKAVVNLTTDAGFGKDIETKMESDSGKVDLNAEDDSTTKHLKAVANLTTDAGFGKDIETKMERDSGKVDLNAEDDSTIKHIKAVVNLTTDAGFRKDIETKMESDSGKVDLRAEDDSSTKQIKRMVNLRNDVGFGKDIETKMEIDNEKLNLSAEEDSSTKQIKTKINLRSDVGFGKDIETRMEIDNEKLDLSAEEDSSTKQIKTMVNLRTDVVFEKNIETKMEIDNEKLNLSAEKDSSTKQIKTMVNLRTDVGFGEDIESDCGKVDLSVEEDSSTKQVNTVVNLTTDHKPEKQSLVLMPSGSAQPKTSKVLKYTFNFSVKPLSNEESNKLCQSIFNRVLNPEKADAEKGPSAMQTIVLAKLASQLSDSDDSDLRYHILENPLGRLELSFTWLFQQYVACKGFEGSADKSIKKYEEAVNQLLCGVLSDEPNSMILCCFFLNLPCISEGIVSSLKHLSTVEKTAEQTFEVVKSMCLQRPPQQLLFLDVILDLTLHRSEEVSLRAVDAAVEIYESGHMKSFIETFALRSLKFLLDPIPEDSNFAFFNKLPEVWSDDLIKMCLNLYFALLPYNHYLISDLGTVYVKTTADVRRTILRTLELPFKKISMSSELLRFVKDYPQGAETFVVRMLHILTDKVHPSTELVTCVRDLYHKRVPDVRFLIPIIHGLTKREVFAALPEFIKLNPAVVKEVFYRLVGSYLCSPLTPDELFVTLHNIDRKQCSLKIIIQAISLCFEEKNVYTPLVLARAIQQLLEQTPLPMILMRTVILTLIHHPHFLRFVINILKLLILKEVWKQPLLWEGFIKCCQRTKPQSFQVLLQLPPPQLEEVLKSYPNLRDPFFQHVDAFTEQQKAHISPNVIKVLEAIRTVDTSDTAMAVPETEDTRNKPLSPVKENT